MEQAREGPIRLLTAAEVATRLGVRPAFVYELARRHLLPVIHVGRYCRFDPVALSHWLDAGGVSDGITKKVADLRPELRGRISVK